MRCIVPEIYFYFWRSPSLISFQCYLRGGVRALHGTGPGARDYGTRLPRDPWDSQLGFDPGSGRERYCRPAHGMGSGVPLAVTPRDGTGRTEQCRESLPCISRLELAILGRSARHTCLLNLLNVGYVFNMNCISKYFIKHILFIMFSCCCQVYLIICISHSVLIIRYAQLIRALLDNERHL